MSPVSRGRASNKRKKPSRRTRPPTTSRPIQPKPDSSEPQIASPVPPLTGVQRVGKLTLEQQTEALARALQEMPKIVADSQQRDAWWPQSRAEVYERTPELLGCADPAELQDAVCRLLGAHWAAVVKEHDHGLDPRAWLEELIYDVASERNRPGIRHLVQGIRAIAPLDLAEEAQMEFNSLPVPSDEPDWLESAANQFVSPQVLVLRDGYGSRFGLMLDVAGRERPRRTYLLDVDLCHGIPTVLQAGFHHDAEAAAGAWRAMAGPSADGVQPEPATTELLTAVLPVHGAFTKWPANAPGNQHFDEYFRADHLIHLTLIAMQRAGHRMTWKGQSGEENRARAERAGKQFQAWLAADAEFDSELIAEFAQLWFEGLAAPMSLACSPHRIAAVTACLNDDWIEKDRDQALRLLEPWVRFCIELTALAGHLAERSLASARWAGKSPDEVGGDLANNLNRPMHEIEPEQPAQS